MIRLIKMIWHYLNGGLDHHQCTAYRATTVGNKFGYYCLRSKHHYGAHRDCTRTEWKR